MKPETKVAIDAFNTLERRKLSVDKARRELYRVTLLIPEEDMAAYMSTTDKIVTRYEQERERLGL
jgi:hypothetical protein